MFFEADSYSVEELKVRDVWTDAKTIPFDWTLEFWKAIFPSQDLSERKDNARKVEVLLMYLLEVI